VRLHRSWCAYLADYQSFKLQPSGRSFGPSEQQRIADDCEVLRSDPQNVVGGEAYCILNELRSHVGAAFPYPNEASLLAALVNFTTSASYDDLKANYTNFNEYTGFVVDGSSITALYNAFNTTMPPGVSIAPSAISAYYNPWRAAVDARCKGPGGVPCELTNFGPPAAQSANYYYWMRTLRDLGREAVLNIIVALIVSYVVLVLVTRNVLVPALAILSIGSTVTMVLATIFSLDYKFDANASILIVVATGLSVDYAVHLSHFYNDQPGTRKQKATMALHGVGLSVCGGALTTGGAAVPLSFAQHFLFFREAGHFILSTAAFGIFFSFTMLIPLFMVMGPEGNYGDIDRLFVWCTKERTRASPAQGSQPQA